MSGFVLQEHQTPANRPLSTRVPLLDQIFQDIPGNCSDAFFV